MEVYYVLGLKNESQKYAQLLGYNYQSSEWYKKSYIIFNKTYNNKRETLLKKENRENNIIIQKFKSLIK